MEFASPPPTARRTPTFLGICLYLACLNIWLVTGQHTSASVTSNPDPALVDAGDDVSVTCHISQPAGEPAITDILWMKTAGDGMVNVANMSILTTDFQTTGRYTVNKNESGDDKVTLIQYILSITGISREDAGIFHCYAPGKNIDIPKEIVVFEAIASLELSSTDVEGNDHHGYTHNDNITFDEGQRRDFLCKAVGSYPVANISIVSGDTDITHMFGKMVTPREGHQTAPGLTEMTYDVELRSESLEMTYMFEKKMLECRAEVPESGEEPMVKGINIRLNGYKPQFLCDPVVFAMQYATHLSVGCTVDADPPINSFQVSVKQLTEVFIYQSNMPQQRRLSVQLKNNTSVIAHGEPEAQLTISRVYMEYFNNYTYMATNSHGTSKYIVEIKRDPNDYDRSSSACRVSSLSSLALLLVIFQLFNQTQ